MNYTQSFAECLNDRKICNPEINLSPHKARHLLLTPHSKVKKNIFAFHFDLKSMLIYVGEYIFHMAIKTQNKNFFYEFLLNKIVIYFFYKVLI